MTQFNSVISKPQPLNTNCGLRLTHWIPVKSYKSAYVLPPMNKKKKISSPTRQPLIDPSKDPYSVKQSCKSAAILHSICFIIDSIYNVAWRFLLEGATFSSANRAFGFGSPTSDPLFLRSFSDLRSDSYLGVLRMTHILQISYCFSESDLFRWWLSWFFFFFSCLYEFNQVHMQLLLLIWILSSSFIGRDGFHWYYLVWMCKFSILFFGLDLLLSQENLGFINFILFGWI